jgi:hypothetical protein
MKYDLQPFLKFLHKNYRFSESVKRYCPWQYAIVNVAVDQNDVITDYKIENKVTDSLKKDFRFLIGYKFSDKNLVGKHVIFFASLENKRTDQCDVPPVNTHESEDKVYSQFRKSYKIDKDTIYIDGIQILFIFDPIR